MGKSSLGDGAGRRREETHGLPWEGLDMEGILE